MNKRTIELSGHIIDSLTGAYGCRILVLEAQKMILEGFNVKEIVDRLNKLKERIQVFICPDVLDYLYRGGRLDKKSAVIGNLAKIKPIIEVSKEGKVEVAGKGIGNNKTMNKLIDIINELQVDHTYPFYTIYTKGTKNVDKFESKLNEEGIHVSEREQLGPVVGTHLGPEAFGVIFVHK